MPPCEGGYKYFKIGNLFDIKKGRRLTKAQMVEGSTNFIGATATNNGITAKIGNKGHIHPAGTITVTYNGSVGEAFYQIQPFWASDDVNVLYPKFEMTEHSAIYFLTPLRKKGKSYGYSYKWTKEMMENDSILLPITNSGEIDFQYIESRIRELEEERVRELEEERVRELEAYLSAAGFADCSLSPSEEEALRKFSNGQIIFKKHTIGKLFEIATGRDIIIGRTQEGQIPLISHQHDNNGITKRIAQIPNRRLFNYEDTISLADRGVFLATTQNEDFHIGTRVKALTFLNGKQTDNVRLFFVSAINQLQTLFTEYLSNATDSLPILEIELPITSKGTVDYDFMETYISAIKKQIIQQLKDFIAKEYAAYLQVINH